MNKTNLLKLLALTVVVIGVSAGTTAVMLNNFGSENNKAASSQLNNWDFQTPVHNVRFENTVPAIETDFIAAAELSVNAVVHVKTQTRARQQQRQPVDPFFEFFFGNPHRNQPQREAPMQQGSGSGVIISPDGYIVTNNHVVGDAERIEVTLNDRRTFEARVVGRDPSTDIALLKIDAEDLPIIRFGNSDELRVGEWVLAVGNPFNLTSTVTAGIVSALARNIGLPGPAGAIRIESFIQTDAAVNPGNSGGALVNTRGELVGINTAIASRTGSFAGHSFAVPSSLVSRVVADLREFGVVQRALLGVTLREITSEFARERNINTLQGVYIDSVFSNTAASIAGVRRGDVITSINGVNVASVPQLQEQMGRHRPGDIIFIDILRNNAPQRKQLELRNQQGGTEFIVAQPVTEVLGARLREVDRATAERLNLTHGVQVESLSRGRLQSAGVRQGYIILTINNQAIRTPEDVQRAVDTAMARENEHERVLFIAGVFPDGRIAHFAVNLAD